MFNLLFVSIIAAMCGYFHYGHERNEMALNAPVTILKCNVSISPPKKKHSLPEGTF